MKKSVHVYCFDFDRTITENQTNLKYCYNPPELLPNEVFDENSARWQYIQSKNIKPRIAEMFRAIWAGGHYAAIVTHCEDRKVIEEHLRVAGLSEIEISHLIIKIWPYGNKKNKNEETKNAMVSEVINEIGIELISGMTFVDDSHSNCHAIKALFEELNLSGSIIHVDNLANKGKEEMAVPGHKFITEIIESATQNKVYDNEKYYTFFGEKIRINAPTSPKKADKSSCLVM